jgi:hypothetical protein
MLVRLFPYVSHDLSAALLGSLHQIVKVLDGECNVPGVIAVQGEQVTDLLVVRIESGLEDEDEVVEAHSVAHYVTAARLQASIQEVLQTESSAIPACCLELTRDLRIFLLDMFLNMRRSHLLVWHCPLEMSSGQS